MNAEIEFLKLKLVKLDRIRNRRKVQIENIDLEMKALQKVIAICEASEEVPNKEPTDN
jgi:hypothetical protein